jgi:uncharacterized membrane protein
VLFLHGKSWVKGFPLSLAGTLVLSTSFVTAAYGVEGLGSSAFSLTWSSAAALRAVLLILGAGQGDLLTVCSASLMALTLMRALSGLGILLPYTALQVAAPSLTVLLWRFMPVTVGLLSVLFLVERAMSRELGFFGLVIAGGSISALGEVGAR